MIAGAGVNVGRRWLASFQHSVPSQLANRPIANISATNTAGLPGPGETRSGAVAQLGERVNGIHEVRGSIPLSSTRPSFSQGRFFLEIFLSSTSASDVPTSTIPLKPS